MRALLSCIGAAALALGAVSPTWAAQPLLSPSELASIYRQPDVRVVDIRPAAAYRGGHVPGAVSAPYRQWRGPAADPGQLPPITALTKLVQTLGVNGNTHVVVVSWGTDGMDFAGAARVYWTLKYLGLKQLSVLNGGFKAWENANLPLGLATPAVTPTAFEPRLDPAIMASTQQVAAQLGDPHLRLVDARPHYFYLGKAKSPVVAIAGTIEGAVNLPYTDWFKPGTGTFVSAERARKVAAQRLSEASAAETITFCNTGHLAAADWFALSEVVGEKNVRLYPESLAEWSQDAARPMQNLPSRGQQILNKLKSLFG